MREGRRGDLAEFRPVDCCVSRSLVGKKDCVTSAGWAKARFDRVNIVIQEHWIC